MVALEALPWRGGRGGYGGFGGYGASYGESLNQGSSYSPQKLLAYLLFCFKGVTVAEGVTVMCMEEDTAEDIGVEVTQKCQSGK